MGEAFAAVGILITVMSISIVLFGGWVAVLSFKGISRLFSPMFLGGALIRRSPSPTGSSCKRCRQTNPNNARFCRRCGTRI
jgi:hypothetical protein